MEIDEQELSALRCEPFVRVDELSVIMEEVQADEETKTIDHCDCTCL